MKKLIYTMIKKSLLLRKLARAAYTFWVRLRYAVRTGSVPVQPKTVLFGAFNGKSYCDSPKRIYLELLNNPDYADYSFIWCFDHPENHSELLDNGRTRLVKTKSADFEKALKESRYWVTNYRIDYYLPKKSQKYIQCWHGTPLKKLGFDIDYCANSLNTVHEFREKYLLDAKKFSCLLSPSPFTTEKFASAFNLKALGKEGVIIEEGYPRNDILYTYTQEQAAGIRKNLVVPEDKKVILYAPTWRDNSHEAGLGYSFNPEADFDLLRKRLGDRAVILFRAHYFIASRFNFDKYGGFVYNVSDYDDIGELYCISDVLVTDYSSVFFDYANLERPIVFYMYDLESYQGEIRDFYFPIDELPGDIVKTSEELSASLDGALTGFAPDSKYLDFKQKFAPHDDGLVSKRVAKRIFDI